MDLEFDDYDDLSNVVGIEILTANDLIPEEFAEGSDRSQLPKQRIGGREFLVAEQSASLRVNSKASWGNTMQETYPSIHIRCPVLQRLANDDGPSVLQRSSLLSRNWHRSYCGHGGTGLSRP
jgi:hypothetical protein